MTFSLYLLCVIVFGVVFMQSVLDSMHYFQLNSYRFDTHLKWLRQNHGRYLPHNILAVLMLVIALIPFNVNVKMLLCILLLCIAIPFEWPRKGKKPLVYTPRVKRMFVTIAILTAAVVISTAAVFFPQQHASVALIFVLALYFISEYMVLLANLINKPIELGVNAYYTRDAKRLLAACDDLTVIGITGSYGKTSVKYFLNTLLRAKFNVLMTPESYNTPMGVVKTVRGSLRATHEIFICEMGAKWVGDIKELCDIVHPQHGIITSIGPQHLESFKTLDAVKKTKFELADALPENGMLFLNGDDENIRDHGCKRPFISYSLGGEGDYVATDVKVSDRGTSFTVTAPGGESERFSTRLLGRHNVLNITGAIAISHKLGIPLRDLKGQVRKLEGVPHRLELSEKNGATIIDDAYNSNPSGTKAALDTFALFEGYKILVTPGMVELGEQQEALNREFGANAAAVCDYVILVGRRQAVPIQAGLLDAGYDEARIFVADSIEEALNHAYALRSGDQKKVILLENDLPDNY